ncbi:MAG TPA: AraC family transcriptional regulator [Myxococcales bacterium]|nr:AraC family transcriptional regulator [Myxococcales bacterium]
MDALSEVLRSFRLHGSIYSSWEFTAPWGMSFRPQTAASFHFIRSGQCELIRVDGQRATLVTGDVAVVFDGSGHRICDNGASRAESLETILARQPPGVVPRKHGGGGLACRMICGKFDLDERESGPATLRHLPHLVHIPHDESARMRSFTATMDLLAGEVQQRESGSERAASLLTEMLLIQVVRYVLATNDLSTSAGWVEGLRDRQIGIALAAIHGEPEKPWSVDSLAEKTGLSRSVFAERFAERVGRTPMSYLAEWRLHVAARLLRETHLSVSEIYQRLGYGSAASFDRAFKRTHRLSPLVYRRRSAERDEGARLAVVPSPQRRRSG